MPRGGRLLASTCPSVLGPARLGWMQLANNIVVATGPGASAVDVRPLDPQLQGSLSLQSMDRDGRRFVSAASGLVAAPGAAAWVVSDEYGELVRFDQLNRAGALHAGVPFQKKKPDLEAITVVPSGVGGIGGSGAVLAIASGSAPQGRDTGVLQAIDSTGRALGAPRTVNFGLLYDALAGGLPAQLNLEGAAVRGAGASAELLLFHRGHGVGNVNKVFILDAAEAIGAARQGKPVPTSALRSEHRVELGTLGGHPLGFSDARALPDGRILFSASAEGSSGSGDGAIIGSAVGFLNAQLGVESLRPLTGPPRKVEGIELARSIDPTASPTAVTLVTDPDDPAAGTEVLRVDLAT
ncbi:MAG: hypothetical protein JWM90_2046 [Thermoleophilia bacterium]|nr:hypothetical protein [Thermoleophilia bacterium]